MTTATTDWPTGPVELEWCLDPTTSLPITGSHGFVFGDSGVMVARVESRGLSIPGGHIEKNEDAEQCLIRESREEVQVDIGGLILLGHIVCDHSANHEYCGPYPVRAAQSVYYAKVTRYSEFHRTQEVSERLEVPMSDLPALHHEWNPVLDAAFAAAISTANAID